MSHSTTVLLSRIAGEKLWEMDDILITLIVVATISVASSMIVVLTPIIFIKMRGKLLMRIVAFISVGDIIGNLPYVFPYRPLTGNWWCYLQSFMHLSGYPMEWLWTVTLVYLLYRLAVTGKIVHNLALVHLVCWGIPISLALLQLCFSNYAADSDKGEVCTYHINARAYYYHNISYYGLFFGSLLGMLVIFMKIYWMEISKSANVTSPPFQVAKSALQWYPTILVIFWVPHAVVAVSPYDNYGDLYGYLLVWKVCHGLATSIVFFAQSRESRKLWYGALFARTFSEGCCCIAESERNRLLREMSNSSIIDVDSILDLDLDHYSISELSASLDSRPSSAAPPSITSPWGGSGISGVGRISGLSVSGQTISTLHTYITGSSAGLSSNRDQRGLQLDTMSTSVSVNQDDDNDP